MARLTQRGLARHLGVNPGHVNRLTKRGVITVGPDGLIDSDQAEAELDRHRSITHGYMDEVNERQRSAGAQAREAASRSSEMLDEVPEPRDDTTVKTRRQFDRARAIRESFHASLVRLDFQQRSGSLVERSVAEKVLFEKARHARDAWLGWPSKTAPLIAAELGLDDSDSLLRVLTAYVQKQIAALGTDAAEFRSDARA